jgi:hypothetical protein
MTNILDSFPSNYLKAADLKGTEPVVTMDRVVFEPVGAKKEMRGVLYFVGKTKGLIINKTNARKIVDITGSAITEQWSGIKIRLYTAETTYAGDVVDGIRIKSVGQAVIGMTPTPPPAPRPPAPTVADEFVESPMPTAAPGLEPVKRSVPMITEDEIPF